MIGYYVHHVGRGHLHRALAVQAHLDEPATALSSLPADPRWHGPWVQLPRDDGSVSAHHPTAGGVLHWAPLGDPGLRARMAMIAAWVDRQRPSVMVVDLSVEVLTLARLMGIPTVALSLPGVRDDAAHRLGYQLADAIVAPWPSRYAAIGPSLARYDAKVRYVGAVSRYELRRGPETETETGTTGRVPRRALLIAGAGADPSSGTGSGASVLTPRLQGWDWQAIGPGRWSEDPWEQICAADVVVTHAGLGALGDVAAARRPAVVIPQARPHQEQVTTATALAGSGLAAVAMQTPSDPSQWRELLEQAYRIGGDNWATWSDGQGGRRLADVVNDVKSQQC